LQEQVHYYWLAKQHSRNTRLPVMKKILLIEDNDLVRENTSEMLELEGYEVLSAVNGGEGLMMAKQALPDVILCDIMMPEVNGYEVLTQLKQSAELRVIPFIFFTASTENKDVAAGMAMGAAAYP
jgi:CheY-like chemotaxis protein